MGLALHAVISWDRAVCGCPVPALWTNQASVPPVWSEQMSFIYAFRGELKDDVTCTASLMRRTAGDFLYIGM